MLAFKLQAIPLSEHLPAVSAKENFCNAMIAVNLGKNNRQSVPVSFRRIGECGPQFSWRWPPPDKRRRKNRTLCKDSHGGSVLYFDACGSRRRIFECSIHDVFGTRISFRIYKRRVRKALPLIALAEKSERFVVQHVEA